ncbi:MAG: leucine-rich repeat domain-containing protein [Ruminococcus sp.]
MKKTISVVINAAVMLSTFSFTVFAEEASDYTFSFRTYENGETSICDYEGTSKYMFIPSNIEGTKIYEIGSSAFSVNAEQLYYDPECYCHAENIVIEEGIQAISSSAFENSKSLVNIELPDSMQYIYDGAFIGCDNMTSVVIPKSVVLIGDYAFGYSYRSSFDPDNWEYEVWGESMDDFIIYGYTGTAAETYAHENEFTFIALDEPISTTTTQVNQITSTSTTVTATTISSNTPESTSISITASTTTITSDNQTTTTSTSLPISTTSKTVTTSRQTTTITRKINPVSNGNANNSKGSLSSSPKTGDSFPIVSILTAIGISAVSTVLFMKKRK